MRLFIAIPIPKAVKEQLAELKQPINGVRWQSKSQIHLTLKFLGETDREQFKDLKTQLSTIDHCRFLITLKGFGYFPQGKQPRVLWADLERSEQLNVLQNKVEGICASLGFDSEDRPFQPHITLGRMKGVPKRDVMSFVNQHKQFQMSDIPIKEFILYESKLDTDGAKHIRLNAYPLEKSIE